MCLKALRNSPDTEEPSSPDWLVAKLQSVPEASTSKQPQPGGTCQQNATVAALPAGEETCHQKGVRTLS